VAGTTVRELITKILFKTDKGSLTAVNKSVRRTKGLMRGAAREAKAFKKEVQGIIPGIRTFIAALVTARATQWITVDFAKEADAAAKFANATGVNIETYQGLAHAVQLAGGEVTDLNKSLQQVGKRGLEVTQGNKTMARAFNDIGVNVRDQQGNLKSQDQLLFDIADRFKGMEDGSRKTGLAMQIFGRTGAKLIPLFNEGSDGIQRYIAEAKKLGIVLSKDQAAAAEKFNDEMLRAKSVLKGLRNMIAVEVLPAMTEQFMAFRKWAVQGDNMQRMLQGVKDAARLAGIALATFVTIKLVRMIALAANGLLVLRRWMALVGRAAWLNATVYFKMFRRGLELIIPKSINLGAAVKAMRVWFGDLANAIGGASWAQRTFIVAMKPFRAALSAALIPGRKLIELLKRLRTWLIAVAAASGISAKAILFFKGVMTAAAGAGKAFLRMLKFIALALIRVGKAAIFAGGKIFLIVASIAFLGLLIEDLVGFAQGRDSLFGRMFADTGFGKVVLGILKEIAKQARQLWKELSGLGSDIGKQFKKLAFAINIDLSSVITALGWILKALLIAMLMIVFAILKALTWLVKGIRAIPSVARAAWRGFLEAGAWAIRQLHDGWNWFVGFLKKIWNGFAGFIKKLWGGLVGAAKTTATAISDAFKTAADAAKGAWTKVTEAIKRAWAVVRDEVLFQYTRAKEAIFGMKVTGAAGFEKTGFAGVGRAVTQTTVNAGGVTVNVQGGTSATAGEVAGSVKTTMDSWWDDKVASLFSDVQETPA
jgi:hypothetical protein